MQRYRRTFLLALRAAYMLALIVVFYFGWRMSYSEPVFFLKGYYFTLAVYAVLVMLFMSLYGGMRVGMQRLGSLVYSSMLALFVADFVMYLMFCLIAFKILPAWPMLCIMAAQWALAIFCCYWINRVYFRLHPVREVVAVYRDDPDDRATLQKMQAIHERFKIVGTVDAAMSFEEIAKAIEPYGSVLIGTIPEDLRRKLFDYCYRVGKRINIIPSAMDIAMNSANQTQIFDTPVLLCRNADLTAEQKIVKRAIDLFFSVLALIIFSPFMGIAALAIKLQDGGPVLFRQARLTQDGKAFHVCKFRSMRVDAEKNGAQMAEDGDARITKIGRFLRLVRFDEVPQLFNILAGDMSIVGPRPERPEFYELYKTILPEFDLRLKAKAGLTGYAQIYGRYNTTPRDKLNMDLFYIENFSLLQDVKLMVMTLKVLFMKESTEGFKEQPIYYISKRE